MARLIVDEDLLRRFVVFSANLADQKLAPNHQVLQPPAQEFLPSGRQGMDRCRQLQALYTLCGSHGENGHRADDRHL